MLNREGIRKLVSMVEIEEVKDIAGADRIQAYRVGGWWIVDGKNKYQRGDVCFMFEIDSLLPLDRPEFAFLAKDNKTHHRLRTMKMKGQISEGLLLSVSAIDNSTVAKMKLVPDEKQDWDSVFGVTKYEPPVKEERIGRKVMGASYKTFPPFLKKTDQERIENRTQHLTDYKSSWEVTRKLDGSSLTIFDYDEARIQIRKQRMRVTKLDKILAIIKSWFVKPDTFGVCSRQVNLPDTPSCKFWAMAYKYDLRARLKGQNIALQGELIGPGVNGNWEEQKDHDFYIFDIWDIKLQRYYTPLERQQWMDVFGKGLKHVPIVEPEFKFTNTFNTIEQLKHFCSEPKDKSEQAFSKNPEGYVWKNLTNPSITFKCINHNYLLSKKD